MAKIASLVVKVGALVFVIVLPTKYAIDLQLLGGVWILQTLPAVAIGLYTRWLDRRALLVGWAAGMVLGTYMAIDLDFKGSVYKLLRHQRLRGALGARGQPRRGRRADRRSCGRSGAGDSADETVAGRLRGARPGLGRAAAPGHAASTSASHARRAPDAARYRPGMGQFHWDPDGYLEMVRAEVPGLRPRAGRGGARDRGRRRAAGARAGDRDAASPRGASSNAIRTRS